MAVDRRMIPSCSIVGSAAAGGGGGVTITLTNTTTSKVGLGTQTAIYSVNAAGTVTKSGVFFENWISDATQAGNYDVRATLVSGTSPAGSALGSWLALTADRYWSITNSAGDDSTISCVLTVEIRLHSTLVVKDTATITISAKSLIP